MEDALHNRRIVRVPRGAHVVLEERVLALPVLAVQALWKHVQLAGVWEVRRLQATQLGSRV